MLLNTIYQKYTIKNTFFLTYFNTETFKYNVLYIIIMAPTATPTLVKGDLSHIRSMDDLDREFSLRPFSDLESWLNIHPVLKGHLRIMVNTDHTVIGLGLGDHFTHISYIPEVIPELWDTMHFIRHFDHTGDCDYRYQMTEYM